MRGVGKMEFKICPKCNKKYDEYPAISRVDNKTKICPTCGTKEALDALKNIQKTKSSRKVAENGRFTRN